MIANKKTVVDKIMEVIRQDNMTCYYPNVERIAYRLGIPEREILHKVLKMEQQELIHRKGMGWCETLSRNVVWGET